jgi:hypothetical protein
MTKQAGNSEGGSGPAIGGLETTLRAGRHLAATDARRKVSLPWPRTQLFLKYRENTDAVRRYCCCR